MIDWAKPIEMMDGTPLVSHGQIPKGLYIVEFPSGEKYYASPEGGTDALGRLRNTPEPDTLFAQPEPDGFASESPIRAFSDWDVGSHYAIGKGFRPALGHLRPYLDAMEAKEGWQLVQLLEATTGKPTFIFRKVEL